MRDTNEGHSKLIFVFSLPPAYDLVEMGLTTHNIFPDILTKVLQYLIPAPIYFSSGTYYRTMHKLHYIGSCEWFLLYNGYKLIFVILTDIRHANQYSSY